MNYKKIALAGVGLFLAALSMSSMAPFLPKAHADTPSSFTWVDTKTISDSTNNNYVYTKMAKFATTTYGAVFVAQRNDGQCPVNTGAVQQANNLRFDFKDLDFQGASVVIMITGSDKTYPTDGSYKIGSARNFQYLSFSKSSSVTETTCQVSTAQAIQVANPNNASTTRFNWVDSQTIISLSNNWIYKNSNSPDKTVFVLDASFNQQSSGGGKCLSSIKELNPSLGAYTASQYTKPGTSGWDPPQNGSTCWTKHEDSDPSTKKIDDFILGQTANMSIPGSADSGLGTGDTADPTNGDAPEINCAVHVWNPLSWILCPLSSALELIVAGLDNGINHFLDITAGASSYPAGTVCAPTDQWCNYYKPWSVIRDISIGLIVIFALIAIVSQALGFEILDAYTLRKVLPRLLVAVIGITLSWPLMMFMINLIDALGVSIRGLIYAPFSGPQFKVALGGGGQFISTFFIGGAIAALGYMGLLSFLATGALAVALAFLVLVLRQMLIVMLVIFAPIAIACYVLPNTQKAWKLWWDSFSKGLLMFPIIAAFIAIGRVFAAVNSQNAGSISQIISFTAYFAPYFMIPFAFRLAGGAVATIGGLVNDRGRGAFDRLKKYRGNKISQNMHDMSTGDRFNNGALNSLTAHASTPFLGYGRRGKEAYDNKMAIAAAERAKSPKAIASQYKDNVNRAATYGSESEALANMGRDWGITDREEVKKAVAGAKVTGGFGRSRQVQAVSALAASKTGYDNLEQAANTIARVGGNNDVMIETLSGAVHSISQSSGRNEMAPGVGGMIKIAKAARDGNANPANLHATTVAAMRGADAVTFLRGKPEQSVKYGTQSLVDHARAQSQIVKTAQAGSAEHTAALDELVQTMGQMEQLNQSKSWAAPVAQEHVNTMMRETQGIKQELFGMMGTQQTDEYGAPVGPPLTAQEKALRARWTEVTGPRGGNPNDPNAPS